ncbi:MAG TPA: LytTR family DNA-binding domain-containing protein [Casimicrobiaceae bacterium]|nr:LytTR family DNA-binding domain-containing protein [Casimicrobiaceae bacterium]
MKRQWLPRRVTALIAEDEPMLRAQLRTRLVEAWPELAIVGEAENGGEALALAAQLEPEVAFLDIRMPVRDGLDVAAAIGDACHVVFVTAYDDYAIEAFERGAIDYVLKPVTAERVVKVVDRLKQRLAGPPADLSQILQQLASRGASGPLRWIKASLGPTIKLIPVDDICYFRAEDKYTRVVTASGDALIRKTIKELFDELDPESFWQVHRGTIVNLRAIARVERDHRDQPLIVLKDRKEPLTVSRTFAHLFKAM